MKKNKKVNPLVSAAAVGNNGQGNILNSEQHTGIKCKRDEYQKFSPLVMFAIISKLNEEEDDDDSKTGKNKKVKKLTLKEIAAIKAATKKGIKEVKAMPYSFSNITPAPKLASKNVKALCSYVSNVLPRVDAIKDYMNCNPAVSDCQGTLDILLPLANANYRDLVPADKATLKEMEAQLRTQFPAMMLSCANLSNGNLPLFALTMVATKRKGTKHNKKLAETNFTLNSKLGKGVMGISCDKIPYSVNYTVYWGIGDTYDVATWKSQNGSARQRVTGLTPGLLYGFVIVANGKSEQGFWAEIQFRNAPYN